MKNTFSIRLMNEKGVFDLKTIPQLKRNNIVNEADILNEIEALNLDQVCGSYVQLYTTNEPATKYTVKTYLITDDFMGTWNITYVGTTKGNIY